MIKLIDRPVINLGLIVLRKELYQSFTNPSVFLKLKHDSNPKLAAVLSLCLSYLLTSFSQVLSDGTWSIYYVPFRGLWVISQRNIIQLWLLGAKVHGPRSWSQHFSQNVNHILLSLMILYPVCSTTDTYLFPKHRAQYHPDLYRIPQWLSWGCAPTNITLWLPVISG
jgi:hypothetical protein